MRKVIARIRDELCYMGLGRDVLAPIQDSVDESNRHDLTSWSSFVIAYMVVCLALSLRSAAFEACRPVYVLAFLACSLTLAYAKVLWRHFPGHIAQAIALFDLATLSLGLGISFFQPDVRSVTMVAIAIIIPTCFIVPTIATTIFQTLSVVIFAAVGREVLSPDVYSFGLLTLVMFSVMGTMMGHLINKARFEKFVYADSAGRLADMQTRYAYYDSLTGLLNRRAYNEEIARLKGGAPAGTHIVMVDVNQLKETNDTFGHEAGDALLVGVASSLADAFGKDAKVYRLGGDEFCAIAAGSDKDIEEHLVRLHKMTAAWTGQSVGGMSVSYGVGGIDAAGGVCEAIREADHRMYDHKRAYYEQAGIDRRRQRQ